MSTCVHENIPQRDLHLPWYAIYVKSRHEKNVASTLASRGYESFLPTYLKRRKDSKKSDLPLFPNYVFCRLKPSEKMPVITAPGVFSIVSSSGLPASIPEAEIESIRRMLKSGLDPAPWPYVKEGQQVCMTSGPLRGVEGVVVNESHHRWLVVSVKLLQRSVAVKVERQYIS
jgi:transcription termination/antitermination protein NusG